MPSQTSRALAALTFGSLMCACLCVYDILVCASKHASRARNASMPTIPHGRASVTQGTWIVAG